MQSSKQEKQNGMYGSVQKSQNASNKSSNNNRTNGVSIWSSWFTVFMVLCVLFGVIAIATPPKGKIVVDGLFEDWEKLLAEKAGKEYLNPLDNYFNPLHDMEKIRVYYDEKRSMLYFGVHFKDSFGYAKTQPNTLHILLDTDAKPQTGYNITYGGHKLGIDYWIEVVIFNDVIKANNIYSYVGDGESWEWKKLGSGAGDRSDDGTFIELGYDLNVSRESRFFMVTKVGYFEYPSPLYSLSQEACLITSYQKDSTYYIKVNYVTKAPELIYITFKAEDCKLFEGGREIRSNMLMPATGGKFGDGELRNISVEYNLSCSVEISNVGCTPNTLVTIFGEKFIGYKGLHILIDGNFNDWKKINKLKDLDDNPYPNVDIREYTRYVTENAMYFYVKVAGTVMGSAYVPKVYLYGEQPANVSLKPYNYSEDYMKINIKLVNGTEKKIEIYGSLGNIKRVLLDKNSTDKVRVALKGSEIEVGLFISGLRALSYDIEIAGLWCGIRDVVFLRNYELPIKHSAIEVDGKIDDWIGRPPMGYNNVSIDAGEFIWIDEPNDERDELPKPGDADILEFRLTSDGTYLYLLVKFRDLNKVGNYTEHGDEPFGAKDIGVGVIITLDYSDGGEKLLPAGSDTYVSTPWERCIFITTANFSKDYNEVVIDGSSDELAIWDETYTDVSTQTKAIFNASGDVLEIAAHLSDLGISNIGDVSLNITVSTIAYNWTSASSVEIGNLSVSNVIDAATRANSTLAEVEDGSLDSFARLSFHVDGNVVDAEGPLVPEISALVPEISAYLLATASIILIFPLVRRFD